MKTLNKVLLPLWAVVISVFLVNSPSWAEFEEVIYYHNDALGSPVAATDSSGQLLWRESYQPYGTRELKESQETDPGTGEIIESAWDETIWYTGKPEESKFGISYFGARWYDPDIGRFLAIDPAEVTPGNIYSFNRYAYANNNPYKFVDPDGNFAIRAQYRLDTGAINYSIVFTPDAASYIGELGIAVTPIGKALKWGEKAADIIPDRAGPLHPYKEFSKIIEHDKEIVKNFEGKKNHDRNTLYTESELKKKLVDSFEKSNKTSELYKNQRKLYGDSGGTGYGEVFDPVFKRARENLEKSNDIHVK